MAPWALEALDGLRDHRRNAMRPRLRHFEGRRGPQHGGLLAWPPDDLKSDGQPIAREPAGNRDGGKAQHREGIGEIGALERLPGRLAADLHGMRELDGEWRNRRR